MITVENATKYYGSQCAVRDLNFTIREGECVGFLGLNGAGKSTTLRLLSCLLLPTSGRVTIRGLDAEESPHEIRKLIGYLPDTPPLYTEMSVRDFLNFAGKLRGMSSGHLHERLPEVLNTCSLNEVVDQPIGTLSHGYRQRVGIAQAIVHRPALLILDEPIQGLDPVQIVEMREMIRALRGKHTILLSTHILSEIERTCDRILMMHEGRVAAEGTEEELESRYKSTGHLELEVRASDVSVRSALGAMSAIKNIEITPINDQVLRVRFATEADIREQISRSIVTAGIGLLSMRRVTSGLESIFMRLSRRDPDAQADAGSKGN